jgi:hypothetical protein
MEFHHEQEKIAALFLALSLTQTTTVATAGPAPISGVQCFRFSGQMSPGVAAAGEYKVIHSYSVKCGTTLHNLTVRTQRGSLQPVTVERQQGGYWSVVAREAYDPTINWGAGNFRVILDNRSGKTPVAYRGSFSLPL